MRCWAQFLSRIENLDKVTKGFREQFLQPFTPTPGETIYPDLYQKLIDDGTDRILEELMRYNEHRKELIRACRDQIVVEDARHDEALAFNTKIVGSDAGVNGVDLRSTYVPLYAAVAIVVEQGEIIEEPIFKPGEPEIWPNEIRTQERELLLSFKIQYQLTREAAEKWNPKYIVMDGAIVLHPRLDPGESSTEEYGNDYSDTIEAMVQLLETCRRRSIPVVGFVKRTRLNTLCKELGFPQMRDTSLLSLILKPGQYTRLEPRLAEGRAIAACRKKARQLGFPQENINDITNIHSVYIRTGYSTPFKLEVPEYCANRIAEVASLLYTTSEEDGIPFVIREADEFARISATTSNIRTLTLFTKALDLVKEEKMSPTDLDILALQFGETWVLHENQSWEGGLAK